MANGTASGMAPLAHVAMYKACAIFCMLSDIMAGMDAAIGDGVDVLSISVGGYPWPFHNDPLAIAAFTAISKGIFVSCSAGNSSPHKAFVSNQAPWILTVGASTIDRKIRTTVYLGNGKLLNGESLYQPKDFDQTLLRPLVYPGEKSNNSATCEKGSLDNYDVKGKVVLCDGGSTIGMVGESEVVKNAGGAAVILANDAVSGESISAEANFLPASNIGYLEGVQIKEYLTSTSNNKVAKLLFCGTVIGVKTAPEIAHFSSRGPNTASPGILKPDLIGPGVNILAAWPDSVFKLLSETSMLCPHLVGIAPLLKHEHPDWSPAAIKYAMMTTASRVNWKGKPIIDERGLPGHVHAIGAGLVNPKRANDPGPVFDIQPDDYIRICVD